jgi:PAS domain S-box-containing protein
VRLRYDDAYDGCPKCAKAAVAAAKVAHESREASLYSPSLFEASPNALMTIDLGGKVTDVNRAAEEATGVPHDRSIGSDFCSYFTEPEKAGAGYGQVLSQGFVRDRPLTIRHASGRTTAVLLNAGVYKDEAGEVRGVLAACSDVTERKRAEDEIVRLNERLSQESDFQERLLQTAQAIILVLDSDARIVRFNPYMEEISGYRLDEVRGAAWIETFVPEHDRERVRQVFLTAIDDYRTRGNINPIVTKDGREREIEWYDRTLRDTDGNAAGLLSVGQDVTERRRAEEALRESEARFRSFFDLSADMVCIADIDGCFRQVNESFSRVLGYSREEILSRPFMEFTHPDDRAGTAHVIEEQLKKGKAVLRFEARYLRKDGGIVWLEWASRPLVAEGVTFAIARDVTERKQAEAELSRIASFPERNENPIVEIDAKGKVSYMNPAARRLLPDLEVKGFRHPWLSGLRTEFARFRKVDSDAKTREIAWGGSVFQQDLQYIREENRIRVYGVDTTERRKAEEERSRVEGLFRATFEHADVGIAHVDLEGAWLRVNQRLCDLLGYTREELLAMRFADITHPDDVDEDLKHQRMLLAGDVKTYQTEKRDLRKDGSLVWVHLSVALICDRDGAPDYFICVITDISERKRTEEARRLSEEKYAAAFKASPDSISITRLSDGEILEGNRGFERLLGYTRAEYIGKTTAELSMWADLADRKTVVLRLREDGEVRDFETTVRRKDGTLVAVSVAARTLVLQGEECFLAFVRDITERKQAEAEVLRLNQGLEQRVKQRTEELASANRVLTRTNLELEEATGAKSAFLANMSHELRTPLNSIIGFSGVLSQELAGSLNEEQRRQVGMINNSGRHLLELVNEVLDLVKIESAQNEPTIGEIDVGAVAREMFDAVRPMAEAKGLEMRWTCADGLAPVRTDGLCVRQILLNLMGNAVKFTESGYVSATVSQDDSGVTVAVEDSGNGIPAEDLERVFDDFYQGTPDGGGKSDGTGLGLTISRRLAGSIGARIEVTSEPGRGSVFTLRIPVQSR